MTVFNVPRWVARPFIWAIVLGFFGFICGFFGAGLLLADMGSAAPLLGIIVVGPIAFLGVMLGGLSALLRLSTRQNLVFLSIAVTTVTVGTLYLAVSEYKSTIWLVDAEIVNCEHVDQLLASKTKMWSEVVVRPTQIGSARPNWQREIPDMLRTQPGVVLMMRIYQAAWVREQQWRWGGISQRADDWQSVNETKQVFAPMADPVPRSPCERFVVGERRFFAVAWEKSNSTPPEKLSRFLWLGVIQQVPPEYVRYLPKYYNKSGEPQGTSARNSSLARHGRARWFCAILKEA